MKRALVLLLLSLCVLAYGEMLEVTRGAFTVTRMDCPQCPMRARFTPDGRRAFLNVARVPREDRAALVNRLFVLMKEAESARARAPKERIENPFLAMMRQDGTTTEGTTRYLTLTNTREDPDDVRIDFATLGLGGDVQVLDLDERVDLGVFTGLLITTVPPRATRSYRFDASYRLDVTPPRNKEPK